MSRNLRRQSTVTPTKTSLKTKRTNRRDDSSDDDYAGVEDISESEDDEPDVLKAEAQIIIDSEGEGDEDAESVDLQDTPRPYISADEEVDWNNGVELSWSDEELADLMSEADSVEHSQFFDDQIGIIGGHESLYVTGDDERPDRHVHFALGGSSDSEESEESYGFPDIFVPQHRLDPNFRREIEDADGSSGSESYWDVHNLDTNDADVESPDKDFTQMKAEREDSPDLDDGTDDEYDSGETTDEDLPVHGNPRALQRRNSSDSSSSVEELLYKPRPIRRGPPLIEWKHDITRSFGIIDKDATKLLIFKAPSSRRPSTDIPLNFIQSNFNMTPDISPTLGHPPLPNLMMSAMNSTLEELINGGQACGPPEAFFPFVNVDVNGNITRDTPSDLDDDDMEYSGDNLVNVEEFLNMDDTDEDDEGEGEGHGSSDEFTSAGGPLSTPARPTELSSEDQVHPLLTHFNRTGVVSAFRNHQARHHRLARSAETPESLAFQGPFGSGTLRGIKNGRLSNASNPITPVRRLSKPKRSIIGPLESSPLAHMTGGAMEDKKRKFDLHDAARSHKRSKSMV